MSVERQILDSREASTMASTWREFLCVRNVQPGVAIAEICQYEVLCEYQTLEDDEGNPVALPDTYNGKKVVGVEDGYVVGGELQCDEDDDDKACEYTSNSFAKAVEWLKKTGFAASSETLTALRNALG